MPLKQKVALFLPLLCVFLSVVLLCTSLGLPASTGLTLRSDEIDTLNDGWTLFINGEDRGAFTLPGYTGARAGDVITLEHPMPEGDLTRVYLSLRTTQMYVRAYVDGALIYTFGDRDAMPYAKSPGAVWNMIELTEGETIRLELSCDYNIRSSSVGRVLVGTRYSMFFSLLSIHLVRALLSLVTMLCGVSLILVGLVLLRKGRQSSLLHLGLFCFTASVWSLMESNALDLIFPYPFFITLLGYLCLMLCPIPMLLFLRSFFSLQEDKLCDALLTGGCGLFAATVLLQLFGLCDLFVTAIAGYGVIILYAVYFFFVMVRKRGQLDKVGNVLFRMSVAVIALFTLADLVFYALYLHELVADKQDFAYFFRIGFLFFILLLAAVSIRQIFLGYRRGVEADVLKRTLQTDMMTGLGSRHNFDAAMEALRKAPPSAKLAMILFDLNNLKEINDALGHKRGDDLIRATASLILEIFSGHGSCYRIGGDEFVVILPSMEHALLERRIDEFHTAAAARSDGDVVIDTAVGYGFFSPALDADISALFTRVDDAMYRNKRLKKQERRGGRGTETTGRRATDMREG